MADELTPRERDVLVLLVAGDCHKVIAAKLGISRRTVEIYAARIRYKLGARNVADLVRIAVTRQMVELPAV